MTTLAVIPARYQSTRLPGKMLAEINGVPLVVHTARRAKETRLVDEVLVATDDLRIVDAVKQHGFEACMTSPDCASGSDRIAEVIRDRGEIDIVVNLQGDEPMMDPALIDLVIDALGSDLEAAAATAMVRLQTHQDFLSPHNVKVVCDRNGRALYFSRSPIPNTARASDEELALLGADSTPTAFHGYKHFGLYVYRREALLRFVELPPSPLEQVEKLEQLRFIENGEIIRVVETEHDCIGVDTPEELEQVRAKMKDQA